MSFTSCSRLWVAVTVVICLQCSCVPPSTGAGRAVGNSADAVRAFGSRVLAEVAERAMDGDREGVRRLVETGGDVNGRSRTGTPLILWVMEKGSIEGFSVLIDEGASVTIEVGLANSVEGGQAVRVIDYVMRAPVAYLNVLLGKGFDPDYVSQEDTHESLVFTAINLHSLPHLERLVQAGASIEWKDSAGVTPLAKAQAIGDYEVMWWLLERGADPSVKDRWGYDVAANEVKFPQRQIDPAQKPWYDKVIAELEKRGLTAKQ